MSVPSYPAWHPQATKRPSPNFTPGHSAEIQAIVLHIAEAGAASSLDWLTSLKSEVSCGFFITKTGTLYQLVSLHDSSWTNGLIWQNGRWLTPKQRVVAPTWPGLIPGKNPNGYTISIEHEGQVGEPLTAAMQRSQSNLLVWLCKQLGWPQLLAKYNLIGHNDINPLDKWFCPGNAFDLNLIAQRVNQALNPALSLANYRVKPTISDDPAENAAPVLIEPRRAAPVAKIGADPVRLPPGFEVEVDAEYNGWLHIAKPAAWGWAEAHLFEQS
jgi:N-acetyl-anhydromuramyl-L-alanine amidase AmpD